MEILATFSYVIFKLYFCKKKSIISPVMAPVNKRSDKRIATPKVMLLFT